MEKEKRIIKLLNYFFNTDYQSIKEVPENYHKLVSFLNDLSDITLSLPFVYQSLLNGNSVRKTAKDTRLTRGTTEYLKKKIGKS